MGLFDGDDGRLLALLDSMEITRLRTGATTAVAAKYLSRPDASRVALFGCGTQGHVQLQALSRVRPLRHVAVHDRDRLAAERLARTLGPELGLDIEVMGDEIFDVVRTSDIVVTCTPARSPFLRAEHVGAGAFIAAVGADREDKQELDVAVLAGGCVVVDALEQCATIGELHHALDAGVMTRADVRAELGDVVAGRAPDRRDRRAAHDLRQHGDGDAGRGRGGPGLRARGRGWTGTPGPARELRRNAIDLEERRMVWVTRERARVDRIACPWLISRFIDREARFLFVPPADVMRVAEREGAIPFDVPGVELGHHGDRCSFDAFLDKYALADPALLALARIVRGADTEHRALTPESAGLYAVATGFQSSSRDDFENMARQFPVYDALYAFCGGQVSGG